MKREQLCTLPLGREKGEDAIVLSAGDMHYGEKALSKEPIWLEWSPSCGFEKYHVTQ